MDKMIIAMCGRSQGKTVLMNKLMEEAGMVVIDDEHWTNVEPIQDRRHDITYEIRKQEELVIKSPPINPYPNSFLRKKKKGGFKKY